MHKSKKSNNAFAICFLISFILHLGGIYLIQKYSNEMGDSGKPTLSQHLTIEKIKKQQILKQVTDHMKVEKKTVHYFPSKEIDKAFTSAFTLDIENKENSHPIKTPTFHSLNWVEPISFQDNSLSSISKDPSDAIQALQLATKKIRSDFPISKTPITSLYPKEENSLSYTFETALAKIEPIQTHHVTKITNTRALPPLVQSDPEPPSQKTGKHSYTKLPTLDRMNTYLYANDFDIEITSTLNEQEPGYIFAITLIPKNTIDLQPINQNFFFLIDRSNPIQKDRLKASRDAVYRSLSLLKKGDAFNILAFDSRIEKLFIEQKKVTLSLKEQAKKFLINQKLASFFASPNIYNCLYAVSNQEKEEDNINTIILLSNGDGLRHKALQHHFMKQWSSINYKKASLFSIAMPNDPHITDLELISVLNRGWLVSSSTKGGIKRKLIKLIKTIQNPILKDVACTAISKKTDHFVELFKPFKQLPHLYANEPYTIIGKCKHLEDFVLVLQGKNQDKWINIKKQISLSNAQEGGESLKEQWALYEAWKAYLQYLQDADKKHLKYAEEILAPYDIPPAFQ